MPKFLSGKASGPLVLLALAAYMIAHEVASFELSQDTLVVSLMALSAIQTWWVRKDIRTALKAEPPSDDPSPASDG